MMKFYHIPEWANYISQDNDGRWFAYEREPQLVMNNKMWEATDGRHERIYSIVASTLRKL